MDSIKNMIHKALKYFKLIEELGFVGIYLNDSNTILLVEFFPNVIIDKEKAQLIVNTIYPHLANGIKLGMTDATASNMNITNEARQLFSDNKSLNLTIAHSVVVKELHTRLLANFFIKFGASFCLS